MRKGRALNATLWSALKHGETVTVTGSKLTIGRLVTTAPFNSLSEFAELIKRLFGVGGGSDRMGDFVFRLENFGSPYKPRAW